MIFYGGEDYQLVAAVDENLLKNIHGYTIIGEVLKPKNISGVNINYSDKKEFLTFEQIENKLYNHFKE